MRYTSQKNPTLQLRQAGCTRFPITRFPIISDPSPEAAGRPHGGEKRRCERRCPRLFRAEKRGGRLGQSLTGGRFVGLGGQMGEGHVVFGAPSFCCQSASDAACIFLFQGSYPSSFSKSLPDRHQTRQTRQTGILMSTYCFCSLGRPSSQSLMYTVEPEK